MPGNRLWCALGIYSSARGRALSPTASRVVTSRWSGGLGPPDAATGGESVVENGCEVSGGDELFDLSWPRRCRMVVDRANEFAAVRSVRDGTELVGLVTGQAVT